MKRILCLVGLFSSIIACTLMARPGATHADGIKDFFHLANCKYKKQEPYKPNLDHQHPPMTLVQLANVIDILEHDLREDGTLVIQQPSVWGQARMTVYRKDFDNEMKTGLNQFKFILSARIARSDQVSLESQTGLAASLGGGTPGTPAAAGKPATPATPPAPIPIKELTGSLNDLLKNAKDSDPIQYAKAFDLLSSVFKNVGMDTGNLGLEPTIFLDEKKRYIDHLNELRRINMGDDTADSAGYGLYLVRMPVSIEPGQKTDQGHGAVLTVTAEHIFGPLFLQRTFRNLVINDLLDQLTPILFGILDEKELLDELNKKSNSNEELLPAPRIHKTLANEPITNMRPVTVQFQFQEKIRSLSQKLSALRIRPVPATVVNGKTYPVAPADIIEVFAVPPGKPFVSFVNSINDRKQTVRTRATDIRLFLQHQLESAYDIMERGIEGGGSIPLSNVGLMEQIVRDFHNRSFGENCTAPQKLDHQKAILSS